MMKYEFYSNVYDINEPNPMFVIGEIGKDDIEDTNQQDLEKELDKLGIRYEIAAEFLYKFFLPAKQVHKILVNAGFKYQGSIDGEALETN